MRLVSFSASDGVIRPGFLFEDTGTILDLTPSGFTSALEVISKGITQAASATVALSFPELGGTQLTIGSADLSGKLDDLRLFRWALSSGQVADLDLDVTPGLVRPRQERGRPRAARHRPAPVPSGDSGGGSDRPRSNTARCRPIRHSRDRR